jgi:hypothetical protein
LRARIPKLDIGLGALAPGLMPSAAHGAIGGAFEPRQVAKVEIVTAERCGVCTLGDDNQIRSAHEVIHRRGGHLSAPPRASAYVKMRLRRRRLWDERPSIPARRVGWLVAFDRPFERRLAAAHVLIMHER